ARFSAGHADRVLIDPLEFSGVMLHASRDPLPVTLDPYDLGDREALAEGIEGLSDEGLQRLGVDQLFGSTGRSPSRTGGLVDGELERGDSCPADVEGRTVLGISLLE